MTCRFTRPSAAKPVLRTHPGPMMRRLSGAKDLHALVDADNYMTDFTFVSWNVL